MSDRKIIRDASIVPLDGRRSLKRGDLLIEGGTISAIGGIQTTADALISRSRGLLIPGLVQAHVDLDQALLDQDFVPHANPLRLQKLQLDAFSSVVDEDTLRVLAAASLRRGMLAGTACFGDAGRDRFWLSVAESAFRLGVRLTVSVDGSKGDPKPVLEGLKQFISDRKADAFVRLAIFGGSADETAPARLKRSGELADRMNLPLMLNLGLLPGARGGLLRLDRLSAVSRHLVLLHGTGESLLDPAAHKLLGQAEASLVICPGFALILGAPLPPIDQLKKAGVNLALGSASGSTRLGFDLFRELRLLLFVLEGRVEEPASCALEIAARGGARALGFNSGEVQVGRNADLVALDVAIESGEDHERVARRIIDQGCPERMKTLWVDGKVVAADGRIPNADPVSAEEEDALRARLRYAAEDAQKSARYLGLRAELGLRELLPVDRTWHAGPLKIP